MAWNGFEHWQHAHFEQLALFVHVHYVEPNKLAMAAANSKIKPSSLLLLFFLKRVVLNTATFLIILNFKLLIVCVTDWNWLQPSYPRSPLVSTR